jgi:hypothetical protein
MISGMSPVVGLILLAGSHMCRVKHPLQKGNCSLLLWATDDIDNCPSPIPEWHRSMGNRPVALADAADRAV